MIEDADDVIVGGGSAGCVLTARLSADRRHSISMGFHVSRPQSRGEIRLRGRDPQDKPIIDHRFMGDTEDVAKLVKGYRIVEDVCRAPALANVMMANLRPDPIPQTDAEW